MRTITKHLLRNQRGFSIVELVLVILLISILAVGIDIFAPAASSDLHPAARKVRMDILYARHMAMLTNVNHGIQFTNGVGYVIYQGTVATPILDPFDKTASFETLARYGNVQVSADYQVEFDSIGRPVIGGGGQALIADATNVVALTVTANTGSVTGL
jgi:prepilin-type N-terminal cleavage/methylation domain-containing protein